MSLETNGIFVDRGPTKFTVKLRGNGAVTCTITKLCIDTLIAAITTTPLPKSTFTYGRRPEQRGREKGEDKIERGKEEISRDIAE